MVEAITGWTRGLSEERTRFATSKCSNKVEIEEVKYNILDFQLCEYKMLCFEMRKMASIRI